MENLDLYNKCADVPQSAQRAILGGKLKGKTDINPMWRIKKLTELFGECGKGWNTVDEKFWTENGANGEIIACCSLYLIIPEHDKIFGIGGSMLIQTEKGQLVSNDEAFKMARTDAISVACKSLGMGANVYWNSDNDKYIKSTPNLMGGNYVLIGGAYDGKTIREVYETDQQYIDKLMSSPAVKREVKDNINAFLEH